LHDFFNFPTIFSFSFDSLSIFHIFAAKYEVQLHPNVVKFIHNPHGINILSPLNVIDRAKL